jgi:hypothetical protein
MPPTPIEKKKDTSKIKNETIKIKYASKKKLLK